MDLLKPLIALLAIVNPIGAVPFFLALTQGLTREQRRRTLHVSSFSAFCVIAISGLAGLHIISFFGGQQVLWFTDKVPNAILVISNTVWHMLPFAMLIILAGLQGVPIELLEAAKIDGAGTWRIFFTIMLPLSTPALVTVAILDGVATWNELLMELIILNSENSKTVPVALLNFQGQFANNNTGLAAGILIAVVPILIAYILLQKWIVGGLTAGATKG